MLVEMLHNDDADIAQSDIRAVSRATLNDLLEDVEKGIKKQGDKATAIHLEDIKARLAELLDEDD